MMRDARINMIGEGANDVLRAFVALVGMRDVGLELKGILDALSRPLRNFGRLTSFAGQRLESMFRSPEVAVHSGELQPDAERLGKLVGAFAGNVERLLRTYRESIVDRQYQLGRIADAAIELYVSACVLKRLDDLLFDQNGQAADTKRSLITGRYYLRTAQRRIQRNLADLWDNDDTATTEAANLLL
jgi:hypothetical protein